jgi:hypothetical protein
MGLAGASLLRLVYWEKCLWENSPSDSPTLLKLGETTEARSLFSFFTAPWPQLVMQGFIIEESTYPA